LYAGGYFADFRQVGRGRGLSCSRIRS